MSDARALDRISLLGLLRAGSEPARPCVAKRPLLRPAPYQPWQPIPAAVAHGARRDGHGVAVADQARALEARHDGEEDRRGRAAHQRH